ncbi:hypothetical protein GCM10010269_79650 [Streptomyces humidus]|uniref:Uncharacterized protein n=1 Tax=Streptomyces humidus TaxID=52259 RepID=A0A918GBS1_9ACTN|nr:hypothetical protein GCM10010269_79650 [Streptomyces humidus]
MQTAPSTTTSRKPEPFLASRDGGEASGTLEATAVGAGDYSPHVRDMTAVSAEAAWLLLVGLALVGAIVTLADGRLRWYPRGLLQWCMVIALAQGPYGMLLASGLIPQAETPAVRIVMLPTWIAGVGSRSGRADEPCSADGRIKNSSESWATSTC